MPKRIIFPRKGEVVLENFELPSLQAQDVRIRTRYSLMSIGTETTILNQRYDADTHFAERFKFPQLKTGMQAVGDVEEIGSHVKDLKIGDHVFMRMAHGSHQVIASSECSLIPDTVDLKEACWCGLAKTAFRAAWAGNYSSINQVLIIGAGAVGQMAVRWASAFGVESILINDLSSFRLEHAVHGGATATLSGNIKSHVERLTEVTHKNEIPVIVDTTGNPKVFQYALAAAPMFGRIVVLGDTGYPNRQCLDSNFMSKGLIIQAVHDSHNLGGWDQLSIDRKFFTHVIDGNFNLSGLITHEFSPEDCSEAYKFVQNSQENILGVLYNWNNDYQQF